MTGPAVDQTLLPDAAARRAAITERERNLLIDAGAGTGKTTILVKRLCALLAPDVNSHAAAIPLARIAAVTFTRKAAGELKLRLREALLRELHGMPTADDDRITPLERIPGKTRRSRLRAALAGLDNANIGTIHGFAERLLRRYPIEAGVSPAYQVFEGDATFALIEEVTTLLVEGAERGTLAAALAGTTADILDRVPEVESTIRDVLQAGLYARQSEFNFALRPGLDTLIECFANGRDAPPVSPPPPASPLAEFRARVGAFIEQVKPLRGAGPGATWLRETAERLSSYLQEDNPAELLREVFWLTRPPDFKKRDHFVDDDPAWVVFRDFRDDNEKADTLAFRKLLKAPLERWMGIRLVRAFPVIIDLYERVKARRQAVDQTDLLMKLRNLLRDNPDVRRVLAGSFDHILVDEFQDTDPLQAEILMFLCMEPRADVPATGGDPLWDERNPIRVRAGTLTIVGDPKQSIYRFRRADIEVYERVRAIVASGPHLTISLSTNFRSVPGLIAWGNDRFVRLLGPAPTADAMFDAQSGTVYARSLAPGRVAPVGAGRIEKPVHVLTLLPRTGQDSMPAEAYRAHEGDVIARYLRWLVGHSGLRITDPENHQMRPIGFGDIAVLALSTFSLPLLFSRLDAHDIPFSSRGGTLFLSDPLHKRFLLGLRALSDPDDGIAEAALLRPPFFALDPGDLLRERMAPSGGATADDPGIARAASARALVRRLRRDRLSQPPGVVARALLEETGFGRFVAMGPNGLQRLQRLRELCLHAAALAEREGLDFDTVTAHMRQWIDRPVQMDPPRPVHDHAVAALTIHQAKGLEWPVVILWDGCAARDEVERPFVYRGARDGKTWAMRIGPAAAQFPDDEDRAGREQNYKDAERGRLIYVAGTRARDLLVYALPSGYRSRGNGTVSQILSKESPVDLVETMAPARPDEMPEWAAPYPPQAAAAIDQGDGTLERNLTQSWTAALAESSRPRFRPVGASRAHHDVADDPDVTEPTRGPRVSRFGADFGTTVHLAIGFRLRGVAPDASAAIARARVTTALDHHIDEAALDVERALASLRTIGIEPGAAGVRIEYPVGAEGPDGTLVSGYVDLVHATDDQLTVIDFKTDAPPAGATAPVEAGYVTQVSAYARMLAIAQSQAATRRGLLFTADGGIRWV